MIYLLRHGETVWNTLGRYQRNKDSSLTKHGISQADLVGKLVYHELEGDCDSFDVQVSPLGRTRDTASLVE
jgi:probable phosphoglycerate mutase